MIDLSGRSAIVVGGGGGGIGTSCAVTLARAGADVGVITMVEEHARDSVGRIEALGRRADAVVADVTDETELRAAVTALIASLGPVQHLVNVVGGALIDDWDRVEDLSMESFDRVLARNLRYALVSCQEVAKPLIDAKMEGSIVNISSVAARGNPLLSAYSTGKGGLEALSRTMALEWGPLGIRVNLVAPGTVKTPRAGTADLEEAVRGIPLRRRATSDDIANAVLFLLSDLAANITAHTLVCDGGASVGPGGRRLPDVVTNPAVRARFADTEE